MAIKKDASSGTWIWFKPTAEDRLQEAKWTLLDVARSLKNARRPSLLVNVKAEIQRINLFLRTGE